jgi:hypothetical protein
MHNDAPTFYPCCAKSSNSTHNDRWICRGGPTAWRPLSPGLNPPDFYMLGHHKTRVYPATTNNKNTLHLHIVDVSQTIRNYPGIFEWIRLFMMGLAERSLNLVDILSTHYKCTLSAVNSQINFFRTHVDPGIFLFWYE